MMQIMKLLQLKMVIYFCIVIRANKWIFTDFSGHLKKQELHVGQVLGWDVIILFFVFRLSGNHCLSFNVLYQKLQGKVFFFLLVFW